MRQLNFENWLVASGETWEKYVCGDPKFKAKMHRRYAIYWDAFQHEKEISKLDKQTIEKRIKEKMNKTKEGNEMNLLEMLEKAMEETLDAMGSVKKNRVKADLKETIDDVNQTIENVKSSYDELHFYTYAGLANMYENIQNIIEESAEEREETYEALEKLTHHDDVEIKMMAHELIARTLYLDESLKNYCLGIKEKMEEFKE